MEYKKIAFFVEGYTEQQFVKRLLREIFGQKNIAIEVKEITGGNKAAISYLTIETPISTDDIKYYVLIYNCNGDSSIKSYILENRDNLIKAGYLKIIGLRDIYPDFERADIFKLQQRLNYGMPQRDLSTVFVLSIMEVECWFLAEEFHYEKINAGLTSEHLQANFNFQPCQDNTENIDEPANFLKDIYTSVGMTYKKEKTYIDRTINELDFTNLYINVRGRILSLNNLIEEFEDIF